MNIAIIGAGFTGLTAAYRLSQKGHVVTVFERSNAPGGLAVGYKKHHWKWSLEAHYHHWFTNDTHATRLADDLGIKYDVIRPKTSVLHNNYAYQFDSIGNILQYPNLSSIQKIRMLAVVGFLKINPFWKPLERFSAHSFLSASMGKSAYEHIWEPQLSNKFDMYYKDISLAWFWARIKKRTPSLIYPRQGFQNIADELTNAICSNGGTIKFNTIITFINSKEKPTIKYKNNNHNHKEQFERAIWTGPMSSFCNIAKPLPKAYTTKISNLKTIGAINVVYRLKEQFMKDGTYWLSICKKGVPLMAIVEHTNFVSSKRYGGEHIVYAGNYMDPKDKRFSYSDKEYLDYINSVMSSVNGDYKNNIIDYDIFRAPVAQPIIPIHYSKVKPNLYSPLPFVYTATMQHVYPWDRGTNYAIELGEQVANAILE